MKILIDPVPSGRPMHCSSMLKMQKLMRQVLVEEKKLDWFFYCLVPAWASTDDLAWLFKHPNVRYLMFPYHPSDRSVDLNQFPDSLQMLEAFWGSLWDYDVLVTSRAAQAAMSRVMMSSPRKNRSPSTRLILVFDEMPQFRFKMRTVAISSPQVQEMQALMSYLAADRVFLTIQHEKDGIMQAAREHLSPHHQQELWEKIQVVSPAVVGDFQLRSPEMFWENQHRRFCLGATDRMATHSARVRELYNVMEKQWVLKGSMGIRVVISTVTRGIRVTPPSFVEAMSLPREQFWKLIKTELDVVLSMNLESGFGMSLVEPIIFGTPVVAADEKWSRALFGDDYPFLAKNWVQAYAMVQGFYDDYKSSYKKFAFWQQDSFRKAFQPGGRYDRYLYTEMIDAMQQHENRLRVRYGKTRPNPVLDDLSNALGHGGLMFEAMQKLENLRSSMADKVLTATTRSLVFRTDQNEYRNRLKYLYGFEDASLKVGHLRRKHDSVGEDAAAGT